MEGVKFVFIFTEGECSEPAFLGELESYLRRQSPVTEVRSKVEVVRFPLGGNQGYNVNAIDSSAGAMINGLKEELEINGDISYCEKWIICDYDEMNRYGTDVKNFREAMHLRGYEVVISKPNFEFFVLACLITEQEAAKVRPCDYLVRINEEIDAINRKNAIDFGFTDAMQIPHYSHNGHKSKHQAQQFFGMLFEYEGKNVMPNIHNLASDLKKDKYTQIQSVVKLYEDIFIAS